MHSNLNIPHTLLFLPRLLIEWNSLLLNLFPQVHKGGDSGPFLVPISFDQEKQEKSPCNASLSTLPTFSQPRICSATVYSVFTNPRYLFFFLTSIYVTVGATASRGLSRSLRHQVVTRPQTG